MPPGELAEVELQGQDAGPWRNAASPEARPREPSLLPSARSLPSISPCLFFFLFIPPPAHLPFERGRGDKGQGWGEGKSHLENDTVLLERDSLSQSQTLEKEDGKME